MRGLFETEGRSPRSMVWWLLPITDYKTVRMKLSVLALQLFFCFEVRALSGSLVGSTPE